MEMDTIKVKKKHCDIRRGVFLSLLAVPSPPSLSPYLPLGLISLLHVRTGSSQYQVNWSPESSPFGSPHLRFPFRSPAPEVNLPPPPPIWRRGRSALMKRYMKQ